MGRPRKFSVKKKIFNLLLLLTLVPAVVLGYLYWQHPQLVGKLQTQPNQVFYQIPSLVSQDLQRVKVSEFDLSSYTARLTDLFSQNQNQATTSAASQIIRAKAQSDADRTDVQTVSPLLFKFALVADSHSENDLLAKALKMAKAETVRFVIGLGDYTQTGTKQELIDAKQVFDKSSLTYFVIPGDHDLWDSRDKERSGATYNFETVFGKPYRSFAEKGVGFILLDNSDNYNGLSKEQMAWLKKELESRRVEEPKQSQALPLSRSPALTFIFTHEPLYHPESKHIMGRINEELLTQAKELIELFGKNAVKEVFSGDIHFFARFTDPASHVNMTTVGAVASQRNIQPPRLALVSVYEDGSYLVEDVEIK